MIRMFGVPKEWRRRQTRWFCPHCKAAGWATNGVGMDGHTRPDGRVCRRAVAKAEGYLAYCDCCNEMKLNVEPVVAFGEDMSACEECRDPHGEYKRLEVRRRMDSMGR